ncbi:MAG TPA: hypothetical protein DDX57_13525 [Bacteroidales bacterium]|nr:hypothetical protein [Bacteroidales bacterium]
MMKDYLLQTYFLPHISLLHVQDSVFVSWCLRGKTREPEFLLALIKPGQGFRVLFGLKLFFLFQ